MITGVICQNCGERLSNMTLVPDHLYLKHPGNLQLVLRLVHEDIEPALAAMMLQYPEGDLMVI